MTIVTLTTDFGLIDPYVAQLKGVILSLAPGAAVHDLSHAIAPGDVLAGMLFLEAAVPRFPAGTVHLAVVDPGVGGERRPLALALESQTLVGPDNGLFSPFFDWPGARAFVLDRPELWLPEVSQTFHGRDVFAPVAARLACGLEPEAVGSALTDPVRIAVPAPVESAGGLHGEVIHVDHFGNLVTNLPAALAAADGNLRLTLVLEIAGREVEGPALSYDAVRKGAALLIAGSTGRLEISVNRERADLFFGVGIGAPVRVRSLVAGKEGHGLR